MSRANSSVNYSDDNVTYREQRRLIEHNDNENNANRQ